jgi:organic radical activating enzyme
MTEIGGPVTVLVSEVFGPTIQGEGEGAGRPAIFVRLGLCNLDCAWCDTPYTWDWSGQNGKAYDRTAELTRYTVPDLADAAVALADATMVVITGGEPFVQPRPLEALVLALLDRGVPRIEIETNGTKIPTGLVATLAGLASSPVRFNVSPKLAGSGVAVERAINPVALRALAAVGATFKFVVSDDGDVAQVAELVAAGVIPHDRVILMPEGRTTEELTARFRWLFDIAAHRGWRLSHRLHVLAHDDERGF